ncbi:MAG: head GIN domain-containing protein [Saprospiraceae bacterium]
MKNLKWPILFLMGISLLSPACFIDIDDDDNFFGCVNGNGPIVSVDLDMPEIKGINLTLPGEVFITQGSPQSVRVEAKQNIIDELELDVNNDGIWVIETDRCVRNIDDFKVFITIDDVTELSITGSGDIVSENFLLVNDIILRITGSGDLDVGLEADDIDVDITGSGNMLIEGTGDSVDARITGSGDLRAFDLEVNRAKINISGSGDAEITAIDELDVRISGSGDVKYKGNPSIDVTISGSGRVVDAN